MFGMKTVPGRLRMMLSLVLAYAAFAGAGFPLFSGGSGALVSAAIVETIVGLSAGLAARFALEGASAAGHMIAASMGLSFGASMIALAALLAAGAHRDLVEWLCRSVITVPPGSAVEIAPIAGVVVTQALAAVALTVRMAFPVLAAVTFGHVALGVVGRTAPQLNIASVGFSITILAGGGALYMTAPTIAEMAANAVRNALGARV